MTDLKKKQEAQQKELLDKLENEDSQRNAEIK
jgi:hypothetical protein